MKILYTTLLHFILVELQMRITTLADTFSAQRELEQKIQVYHVWTSDSCMGTVRL